MPPKKSTKKATTKKGDTKKGTSQSKKGTKGKKKKVVHEGPIDWKLSKDRLEELRALNLISSKIKTQITADLEPLTKAFAPREPFKHWTLKSPEIPLLGIASSDAKGVLCKNEPLYPVIDTADRRAITRCWRAIRLHFEPIGPPIGVEEEEEEYDIFGASGGGGGETARGSTANSNPGVDGEVSLFGNSPGGSRAGSRNESRGSTAGNLSNIEGYVGPMTLYGMSRWLNNRGEKFPGSGFPYDEVVWKPLEVLILRHFRKTKDGFLKAKWKQPPFNPLSSFKPGQTTNFKTQRLSDSNNGASGGGGMFPQIGQFGFADREDSLDDDDDDDGGGGGRKSKKSEEPPWSSRTALISCLIDESELIKLKHEVELPPDLKPLITTPTSSVPSTARSATGASTTGGGKKKKKGGGKNSSTGGTTTPPSAKEETAVTLTLEEIEEIKEENQAKLLAAGPEVGRVIAKVNEIDENGDGAHLNLSDAAGNFAISIAAERGCTQAVFMLAKAGCYIDAPGQSGNTALHVAASAGYVDVVKALIAAGADTGAQNAYGESALHLASRYGHADVVKLLVAGGAPVSSWTTAHHSPIHFAAGAGHLPCLKLLDKAAAAEGKTKGKKGASKSKSKKRDSSAPPTTAPPILGAPIDKATVNSLTNGMEPPILRTMTALGGRSACQEGEVLKDPNNAGLSVTLQYLGGKFKDPLAAKPAKGGGKAGAKKKK